MAKKANKVTVPAAKPTPQPTAAKSTTNTGANNSATKWNLLTVMAIVLAVVAILVYWNTRNHGYVLDDVMVCSNNLLVKKGASLSNLYELMTTPHLLGYIKLSNDTYRPLSLVMFAIEQGWFGDGSTSHHVINILFFAGCVVAFFYFINDMLQQQKPIIAFIAAILFAVHPVHTEIVANIKSRDEILCFFFAFAALNLFTKYMRTANVAPLIWGAVCMLLSYLSKETVITFVAIVPLVYFLYINTDKKRAWVITGTTLAVTALFLIMRYVILSKYNSHHADQPINFIDNSLVKAPNAMSRLATEIYILGDYLKMMFIPYPLVCDHSFNSIPYVNFSNIGTILSIVIYLGMGGWAVWRLIQNKKDLYAFGIIFYLATISLFTNIFITLASTYAERFLFFCSAGTCLIIAVAIDQFILKNLSTEKSMGTLFNGKVLPILAPLVLVYSYMTYARNADWADNITLYSADVDKLPNNTRLNYYMGSELQHLYGNEPNPAEQQKINNKSIEYLRKSLAIYNDNVDAVAEIGAAYLRANLIDSSIFYLKRAIQLNPKQSNAMANLGTLYLNKNDYPLALYYYRSAFKLNPNNAVAAFNGGVCYYQLQKLDSAIIGFKNTIRIAPDFNNFKSYEYTAIVYKQINKLDSAAKYAEMAKQYNPNFVY